MSPISIWKKYEEYDLTGYTVIIPSVAVGNVGQLACDLLISSLGMNKCASIYSPALIPVVGYNPYDLQSDQLSSCCELYRCSTSRLAIIQLRAPLVYKYANDFLNDLMKTLKECRLKDIVILTSSHAHEKRHVQTSQFRYMANELCPYADAIKAANWIPHDSQSGELKIFGGGFASLLYDISGKEGVPCLVVYAYCSEGDNIPDAYDMINLLVQVLPLFKHKADVAAQLVQPLSWKLLFGRPPPTDIY